MPPGASESAPAVTADARGLSARGRSLQRRGTVAVVVAVTSLLLGVFSLPSGVLAVVARDPSPFWQSALIVGACTIPLLGVPPSFAPGLLWLIQGTRLRESATAISSRSFGGTSQAGIARARYDKLRRSLLIRGIAYGVLAIPTAIWLLVWIPIIAVSVFNTYHSQPGLLWLKVLVLFVLGGMVLPGALTALLAWRSVVNLRNMLHLRQLVVALSAPGARSFDDLGQAMGIAPQQAEFSAVLAMSHGVLDPVSFAGLQSSGRSAAVAPGGSPRQDPGTWLGRVLRGTYVVEAPLGKGGMGAVYRARDLRNGGHVALKVLLPGAMESPDALRRLQREAQVARGLTHPGLVRVGELGTAEDGLPFLVMELLEGESLQARLERQGALPWPAAREIALSAAEALAVLHEAGLLHRDLKPSNIFLSRGPQRERVVLIDFGLARRIHAAEASRLTSTGQVLGTPLYMSPEQAKGEPLDVRSDIFGLGVVVHEMLTGVPPFFDVTMAQVYARLLNESLPPPALEGSHCPAGMRAVVGRAIARRREERYPDVRAFLEAMRGVG